MEFVSDRGRFYRSFTAGLKRPVRQVKPDGRNLERETGIEPATNGLGSRYSTIELLPLLEPLYLQSTPIGGGAVTGMIARFCVWGHWTCGLTG
jgi:hypothetical protein